MSVVSNQEILNISSAIQLLKSKNQVEKFGIKILRNKRLLQPTIEEFNEIVKELQDKWKGIFGLDEVKYESNVKYANEANASFTKYQTEQTALQEFPKETKEIEFITIPEDSLVSETVDWDAVEILIGNIVTI